MAALSAFLFLALGFYILIKGADFLVDGAAAVARRFGISQLLIGITLVGFGTSTPELITSIVAASKNESSLVLGNVIGSNIANVALILGISALISPLIIQSVTVRREMPFTIAASVALLVLIYDSFFYGINNYFSRGDAIILLIFFAFFIYFTISEVLSKHKGREFKKLGKEVKEAMEVRKQLTDIGFKKPVSLIFLGMIGVLAGGILVVDNAVIIAGLAGLSTTFIGLTIIALGTSLPELVTSAVAAYKKETDVAVGNIVGSNIFNLLFILSVAGIISPFAITTATVVDVTLMTVIMIILLIFSFSQRVISRYEGAIFIINYFAVMGYVIYREIGYKAITLVN